MEIHSETPPPPSPMGSEPPPSYDSLSPATAPSTTLTHHLPQHHRHHHNHPSTASSPPRASEEQQQHQLPHVQQWTIEDMGHTDGPPPPPYSPGLRNFLGVVSRRYEDSDAPPSYYSLFGQIQEVRRQTTNNITFVKKLCQIILGTVGCTFLLIVLMFVPLTVSVLGAIFVGKCPLQPLIPLFLIIGGLCGMVKTILIITENIVRKKSTSISSRVQHPKLIIWIWRITNLLFNLFTLAWVVVGSYWVYSIYRETVSDGYSNCNIVLYKLSFSFVTCSYIVLLLMFLWMFCLASASLRRRKNRASERASGENRARGNGMADLAVGSAEDSSRTGEPESVVSGVHAGVDLELEGVVLEDVVSVGGAGVEERAEQDDEFPAVSIRESLAASVAENMEQQALSTGNLTNHQHHSNEGMTAHSSELQLPDVQRQPRTLLFRFDSSPCPRYPLRQASFGSNDSSLPSSRPTHTTSFKEMRSAMSFSQFLSQTQLSMNHHRSIPSLSESYSYNLDPRHYPLQLPRNDSFREESGCDSNRSSLYNTIHSDGYSITAV